MPSTLTYHNFSWRGDPRWSQASRLTLYAPVVVGGIFILSVVQIALGSIWVVEVGKSLSLANIIPTLLLPGLSFFNALPSLHLHLLLRRNPPLLATIASSTFALVYLVVLTTLLASCIPASQDHNSSLRRALCAGPDGGGGSSVDADGNVSGGGVSKSVWSVLVALGFVSAALYACHAGMAMMVRRAVGKGMVIAGEGSSVDEIEARRVKARELWVKATRVEGL